MADKNHLPMNDLFSLKEGPELFMERNPSYDWRIVSTNLRAVRLAHHLKQREAAIKIGIDRRTLITYEKGDACPNWDVLYRIMPFYPGDLADFFYRTLYPEIQASPSFRKRGSLPFFVFFLGALFGAGVLGSVLLPFSLHSGAVSSSTSAPYHNWSWSGDSSSGSSSESSPPSSSSSLPISNLTELVVIGPTGSRDEVPMLFPATGKTSTLQVGLYTNEGFLGVVRRTLQFKFSLDGFEPSGVTISGNNEWGSADSATITAYNDPANPMPSTPYPYFAVFVWARYTPSAENPNPAVMEGTPLNIAMTANGTYQD